MIETDAVVHVGMAYTDVLDLQDVPGREEMEVPQIEKKSPAPVFHLQINTRVATGTVNQHRIKHGGRLFLAGIP
jgi:hypothetical protein